MSVFEDIKRHLGVDVDADITEAPTEEAPRLGILDYPSSAPERPEPEHILDVMVLLSVTDVDLHAGAQLLGISSKEMMEFCNSDIPAGAGLAQSWVLTFFSTPQEFFEFAGRHVHCLQMPATAAMMTENTLAKALEQVRKSYQEALVLRDPERAGADSVDDLVAWLTASDIRDNEYAELFCSEPEERCDLIAWA